MASDHVLSIPRSDSEGDNVLVDVVSYGKAALDVKLVATEGESPYINTSSRTALRLFDEQLTTSAQSDNRVFRSIKPRTAP